MTSKSCTLNVSQVSLMFEHLLIILWIFDRYLQDQGGDQPASEMNYGAGKSKFYAASDRNSHASVSKLLPINPNKDRTLYLSR